MGTSGASGVSGFSGYSAKSGYSGLSGTSGFSGAFSGASGTSGWSGIPGTSGFSGVVPTIYDAENFIISGGGSSIQPGICGDIIIAYAATLVSATLIGTSSGSVQVDVWKSSYAGFPPTVTNSIIGAGTPLQLSNAQKYQDNTLSGWTTTINAGDVLRFSVTSAGCIQQVTVSLKFLRD
jgi:hypothetical protein